MVLIVFQMILDIHVIEVMELDVIKILVIIVIINLQLNVQQLIIRLVTKIKDKYAIKINKINTANLIIHIKIVRLLMESIAVF